MMPKPNFFAFLILTLLASSFLPAAASPPASKVYIIPVSGMVEPGMAAYVKRAIEEVEHDKNAILVFKLDTFGGRVDAAFEIVETISAVPKERTIAYLEKRAISAGALIALASGTLIMKENTLIGDCAPIIQSNEGQKEAGEKTQTVLRAQFRTLAKRNNYPEVLAEAMVTKSMEVYSLTLDNTTQYMDKTAYDDLSEAEKKKVSGKKTIVAKGELLTMDDTEAKDLGFSKTSVKNLDQALAFLGVQAYQRIEISESWSENLVRVLQPFLPLLMLLGIGAVYTEIKAPGFGIPGIIGIFCLGLVFFNQYLVGLADYTELLVFFIGFLLLGVEVFVLPGFGVAGISALMVIGIGLVLSFQNFVFPDPALPWEARLMLKNVSFVMGSFLGALVVSFLMIRFVLPRISTLIKGPYLSATLEDARADSAQSLEVSPGEAGIALTQLRPSGKIRIKNKKIDAITQGDFIDANARVRVLEIVHNHVIVEKQENKEDK
ncbi:MAG: serine protease [Desulfobacter sp.]|nr:serine protease [Desulfobacter sp.]WDP84103.1 MAG: serine protease [Desulfobacter sp.]